MTSSKMSKAKRLKLETRATLRPILPDELITDTPLIDIYVGTIIDAKNISKVITQLNSVLPIPELVHLKRVKGKQVLLLPTNTVEEDKVLDLLEEKGFDTNLIDKTIQIGSAAKIPPKVRKQYQIAHKLWPCNFHSNPYLEKLTTNTLFSDKEMEIHEKFMRVALDICHIAGVRDGAVIVDPVGNSLVGFGYDQRDDYPIKHGVMVAIDAVAKTQNGGVWDTDNGKIEEFIETKYKDLEFGFSKSEEGPYLCTGYSLYTVCEPCITCAMALVHSRIKRVFYGVKNDSGALGSLCKIHIVENLNHHYEAFAGLLEDECRSLSLDYQVK